MKELRRLSHPAVWEPRDTLTFLRHTGDGLLDLFALRGHDAGRGQLAVHVVGDGLDRRPHVRGGTQLTVIELEGSGGGG